MTAKPLLIADMWRLARHRHRNHGCVADVSIDDHAVSGGIGFVGDRGHNGETFILANKGAGWQAFQSGLGAQLVGAFADGCGPDAGDALFGHSVSGGFGGRPQRSGGPGARDPSEGGKIVLPDWEPFRDRLEPPIENAISKFEEIAHSMAGFSSARSRL